MRLIFSFGGRAAFGILVFAVLVAAITSRPTKRLHDFDQQFYLTIAYDLERHGVFSNGIFDRVDSTVAVPPPGMFFAPVYPALVLAAMKLDPRFGEAARCSVEADHKGRPGEDCEVYARPIHLMNAMLLTIAVLAIALCGEIIFGRRRIFFLTGAIATAGFAAESELLSHVMTESATVSLYSLFALFLVLAWKTSRTRHYIGAGVLLGALCLTRSAYLVLAPAVVVLIALNARRLGAGFSRPTLHNVLAFVLPFLLMIGAWATRNAVSIGKFALSEEYGSVSLIERFAYNDMTAREFAAAGVYCVPTIGPYAANRIFGEGTTARFEWWQPGGFFDAGRARRNALVAIHGRLDPIIGDLIRNEMRQNWWRYLATILPLAWCGLWMSGIWSVFFLPMFAAACVQAIRRPAPLFVMYAIPPLIMVGVHAVFANHYTRYNLGLIGPISVGSAWIILNVARAIVSRRRETQPV